MMDIVERTIVAGFAVALATVPAFAQTAAPVFQSYNLLGTFSANCGQPASPQNFFYIVRQSGDGGVQIDEMTSTTNRAAVMMIDRAQDQGGGRVQLAGTRDGQWVVGVWQVEANRFVQLEAAINGVAVVQGGIHLASGQPVLYINRCGS